MFKVPKLPLFPNHFTFFQNETKNKEHRNCGLVSGILTDTSFKSKIKISRKLHPTFQHHINTLRMTLVFQKEQERGMGKISRVRNCWEKSS